MRANENGRLLGGRAAAKTSSEQHTDSQLARPFAQAPHAQSLAAPGSQPPRNAAANPAAVFAPILPADQPLPRNRLVRLPEVRALTSLSRSSIDRYEAAGIFPRRRRIGLRAVAWDLHLVLAFIASRSEVGK